MNEDEKFFFYINRVKIAREWGRIICVTEKKRKEKKKRESRIQWKIY